MKKNQLCTIAAAAAFLAGPASAELLLYEGFDYATGVDALVGQSGGEGWGGTVYAEGGNTNAGSIQNAGVASAGSLVFSDFVAIGNVGQIQNNNFGGGAVPTYANHYATRALPALSITPGSTVYSSFLFRQEQNSSFAHQSEIGLGTSAGALDQFRQISVDLFDGNGPDEVGVGYGSSVAISATTPSVNKQPLLFITRFENVNGAGTQTATMYVLSESDYDSIKAGGITQSELDGLGAVATDTATGITLGAGDYFTISATTGFGVQNNSFFDEFRLFTDLEDLQSTVIPEPASLALVGLGGLACIGCWRKRR